MLSVFRRECCEASEFGETGFVVPSGDAVALSAKMRYLCWNPKVRLAMGKISRACVVGQFDLSTMVDNTLRVYESVASKP